MARKRYNRRKSSRKKYTPLKNTENYNSFSLPTFQKRKPRMTKPKITKLQGDVFPKVTYKVVASGTNEISQTIKPSKPRISPMIQSMLVIVLVMVLTPLFTGGAIGLGVYFGGEDLKVETPITHNGISVFNTDCAISQAGTLTYSNPTIPHTMIYNPSSTGESWTSINTNTGGLTNPPRYCDGVSNGDVNLSYLFPSDIFDDDTSYSRIVWNMTRTNAYSSSFKIPTNTFDFSLTINGSTVFDLELEAFDSSDPLTTLPSFEIDHTFTISEYNNLKLALNDCGDDCDIRFNINNWINIEQCPGSSSCAIQTQQLTGINLKIYETDNISSDFVLTVSPWLLGIVYMLVALASTSLWNPIFKDAKRRFSNGV